MEQYIKLKSNNGLLGNFKVVIKPKRWNIVYDVINVSGEATVMPFSGSYEEAQRFARSHPRLIGLSRQVYIMGAK